MGLYQAGAGVGVSPSGRHPVGIYKQTRGTAQWAVPLFRFSCPGTQEKGTPPPAPPPATRWGGVRSGCFTGSSGAPLPHSQATPAARAAPALWAGLRPRLLLAVGWAFGKCGLRRSPRGAPRKAQANRQRVPPRWGTPAIAAPRGHQAATLPPLPAPPAWLPLRISDSPAGGTGSPGTPPLPVRRAAAGRAFPLGRSLRPLPGAPGRSPAHAGALAP